MQLDLSGCTTEYRSLMKTGQAHGIDAPVAARERLYSTPLIQAFGEHNFPLLPVDKPLGR